MTTQPTAPQAQTPQPDSQAAAKLRRILSVSDPKPLADKATPSAVNGKGQRPHGQTK